MLSTNSANNNLTYDTEYEFFEDQQQSQASNSVSSNYFNRLKQQDYDTTKKNSGVSEKNFADDICNLYAAVMSLFYHIGSRYIFICIIDQYVLQIQNTITELTSFVLLMLSMHSEVQVSEIYNRLRYNRYIVTERLPEFARV